MSFTRTPSRGFVPDNFTLANYHTVLVESAVRSALFNSLVLGLASATIIGVLGFVIAYIVTRTRIPGRSFLDLLSILPLGVAGTAFAVGVIVLYLDTPVAALGLYGTLWILLIAYIGRYIPYGVRTAQVSLLQVSRELEEAARVAGGSQLRTLWDITLPLVRSGVLYAWILGFLQAFPEVSASAMLRGPNMDVASTALLAVYGQQYGLPTACALAVVIFVVVMALLWLAQQVGGRSIVPRADEGGTRLLPASNV
jgi:iron(III) transport system permease protein